MFSSFFRFVLRFMHKKRAKVQKISELSSFRIKRIVRGSKVLVWEAERSKNTRENTARATPRTAQKGSRRDHQMCPRGRNGLQEGPKQPKSEPEISERRLSQNRTPFVHLIGYQFGPNLVPKVTMNRLIYKKGLIKRSACGN